MQKDLVAENAKPILERLAIAPEELVFAPASLSFESTKDIEPLDCTMGQDRAIDAIEFGVEMKDRGFNIFVAGQTGSGRKTTVRAFLAKTASAQQAPQDWVYVHNFADPYRPTALSFAPGEGSKFARRMDDLVASIKREVPKAFEAEGYGHKRERIVSRVQQQQQELLRKVQQEAASFGFHLEMTQNGIATVPVVNGQPISAEDYEKLTDNVRETINKGAAEIKDRLEQLTRQTRKLEKEAEERLRRLDEDTALAAVSHPFDEMGRAYAGQPKVLEYLASVKQSIPEGIEDFKEPKPEAQMPIPMPRPDEPHEDRLARYRVNVFVDNGAASSAPFVEEPFPNYYNLAGRIEFESRFGGMFTDFMHIKPGAIHRANGGYLLLEAADLVSAPGAWEGLKKALLTREARIENLGEVATPSPAATLKPEPIPLRVKIVLVGNPAVYYALYGSDEDFRKLFKVKADFEPDMECDGQNVLGYAAFVSRQVHEKGLRHFDRGALIAVLERSARMVEDRARLSTQFSEIVDLVCEASFWAGKAGRELVTREDVAKAIDRQEYRSGMIAERSRRMIEDGTIMISVDGVREGQVNGLAVAQFGDVAFGSPSRITARTSPGNKGLVAIEREISMSGPIHSKGVLTLSGYLAGKYAHDYPLALSASLAFEQQYGGVDGDSASCAELYALLSSISGLPIDQGIAVTGSVNQYGEVQAVGGVTHKVEGFFDICKANGFTGRQGVMLPASNVKNLVLKAEVVQALREGMFHIWAVRFVDEGIEILTGMPAGERGADRSYPAGSVHQLVDARLRGYAELQAQR